MMGRASISLHSEIAGRLGEHREEDVVARERDDEIGRFPVGGGGRAKHARDRIAPTFGSVAAFAAMTWKGWWGRYFLADFGGVLCKFW